MGIMSLALLKYGFHETWVALVMKMVTSVSDQHKINGFVIAHQIMIVIKTCLFGSYSVMLPSEILFF